MYVEWKGCSKYPHVVYVKANNGRVPQVSERYDMVVEETISKDSALRYSKDKKFIS